MIAKEPANLESKDTTEPETRSFRQIFATSKQRFAEEEELRRHHRIERDRWVLEAQDRSDSLRTAT